MVQDEIPALRRKRQEDPRSRPALAAQCTMSEKTLCVCVCWGVFRELSRNKWRKGASPIHKC